MLRASHLRLVGRASSAAVADPVELGQKLVDRVIERRERQRPPPVYVPEQQWEARMHELIGADWPCPAVEEFRGLWSQLLAELSAAGIRIGRGAFGGWGDGEPAFTRACW